MKREYQVEELLKENQTIISILSEFCKNLKYNQDFRDYIFTLSIRITPISGYTNNKAIENCFSLAVFIKE